MGSTLAALKWVLEGSIQNKPRWMVPAGGVRVCLIPGMRARLWGKASLTLAGVS